MICVSLGRTRHKMMIAEHKVLAEKGAQLVELRLDWLGTPPDLGRLLKDKPTPVVITCRRAQDKGLWKFGEDQRQTLLRSAIVAGVDYVDLEEDIAGSIRRFGSTKRIVSYHNFEETPANLEEIHARLASRDPDIVKLVTTAKTPEGNVRLLEVVKNAKVPTVGFCMGDLGVWSRILCRKYGSPFTYATFSAQRTMAPGQLTFEETRDIFHFDQINRDTQVFGVVADPVAHSLSPLIHNAAYQAQGLNAVYLPFRIPREHFTHSLHVLEALDVRGYSVTIPHKVAALELAQTKIEPVAEIGALNTLFRGQGGEWCGANTDCDAALASLRLALDPEGDPLHPATDPLAGKRVLILGAGGAARAIATGLIKAGAAVMHPKVDESPFQQHWLDEGMIVFDTVYTPERTLLIAQARERGCRVVTGVEMFVRQAARQYEYFTGKSAPIEVMRATLKKAISVVKVT